MSSRTLSLGQITMYNHTETSQQYNNRTETVAAEHMKIIVKRLGSTMQYSLSITTKRTW